MPRCHRPIREGVTPGHVPEFPVFTFEEVSIICRRPGVEPSYHATWRMIKRGVRFRGREVKLIATRMVGGLVITAENLRKFLRQIGVTKPSNTRAAGVQGTPTERLRRGDIGSYELPRDRQLSLHRAETDLSNKKAESSGRVRHGKGRVGANV